MSGRHWWRRLQATSPVRIACAAWALVTVVCIVLSLREPVGILVVGRATRAGEQGVSPNLWLAVDYLLGAWALAPALYVAVFSVAAWATWRIVIRGNVLLESPVLRGLAIGVAIAASVAVVVPGVATFPAATTGLFRAGMCTTTTFDEALSPNGRYRAAVVQVDCGAMNRTSREVVVARRFAPWTESTLLYFEGIPSLQLSWSGRTLTVHGDRTLSSMGNPPPDPIVWGGVLVRYAGPAKDTPAETPLKSESR